MDFTNDKLINEMDVLGLVSMLRYVSYEERKRLLSTSLIKGKLKNDLLRECNTGDVYRNFRWLFEVIDVDDFFGIFDYDTIHEFYKILGRDDFPNYIDYYRSRNHNELDKIDNEISESKDRNQNEYKLFVCLMEKDINTTMKYILSDNDLFKEVMFMSDNMYSMFSGMDYEYIVKMIYKLEENNFYDKGVGLNVISSIGSDNQRKLLDEGFSDDTLLKIIPYFRDNVISYFFDNDKRATYLYNKFSKGFIVNCVDNGIKFNREILLKDDFFDRLKSSSFVDFRRGINAIEKNNDYLIIEKKVFDYYKEIISEYDYNSGIFKVYNEIIDNPSLLRSFNDESFIIDYNVRCIFSKYKDYDKDGNVYFRDKDKLILELRCETSKRISKVVVDALFCDNIYNVCLNIKEMLRFNDKLYDDNKVLDDDKVRFYKMILNFDSVSSDEKIELFNKLYSKNISFSFYDDLRKIKDLSYNMIKNDLINLDNYEDKIINDDSGVKVYDLRDGKYTMLVRAQCRYRDVSNNRRNCYSIISDENSDTFGHGKDSDMVIYGYNSFDNDTVLHVLEQDAFSIDIKDSAGSRYVNRIMTSKEITNGSSWYSEIELVNIQNGRNYMVKKPDYIVVYDCIRDIDIEESKRLDIPIVVISKTRLKDKDRIDIDFDHNKDIYINSSYEEVTYHNRR